MRKFSVVLIFVSVSICSPALMLTETNASEPGSETATIAVTSADPDVSISEEEEEMERAENTVPRLHLPGIKMLDVTHSYFSRQVEGLSDSVDLFFGSDRIFAEASGTYVQLRGSAIFGKSGERTFDSRIRAKVSLDNLNGRVQFLVSGEEEPTAPRTVISGGELSNTFSDLDPAAALQFVLLEQQRWDIRLQPGVKFRAPVDPFFKVRLRRYQPLGENWLWRTTLVPVWYDSRGYEFPVTVDFERGTSGGGLFRSSSSGVWREEDPANLYLQESLLFSHPFGSRNLLAYTAGVGFEREPRWRDTQYFANIRFRRNIHQGWLFFEVTPQVLFERGSDFKAEPSLAITLELLFGGAYLE